MIAGDYRYHNYFPEGTRFLYTGASLKDRRHYAFGVTLKMEELKI